MFGWTLCLRWLGVYRVDRAERVVHQEHWRIGGEPAGDADSLLLSAGELTGIAVAIAVRVQADQVEQLVDASTDPIGLPAQHLGHNADVGGHAHVREEAAAMDHIADLASDRKSTRLNSSH